MYQVTTYKEKLKDVDVKKWKREMDHEMESMGSNSIWSLVDAPREVKPFGSKLIYKKKSPSKPCVDLDVQEWKRQGTVRWNLWVQTQFGLL